MLALVLVVTLICCGVLALFPLLWLLSLFRTKGLRF
jgi:hypothetical protein